MAARSTAARKIKLMISSQCKRKFPIGGRTLTEIRRDVRDHLEASKMFGQTLFEVWINEDAPGHGTDLNSWDACLEQVRKADILIVLNAEHGGWAPSDGDIGICHAELMTAHNSSPAKIRIIPIRGSQPVGDELRKTNERFNAYISQINPFAPSVATETELMEAVDRAVVDAVASLVELGVREARKGRYYTGDALEWSKLPFETRAYRMRETMMSALTESGGKKHVEREVEFTIAGTPLMLHLHASPASLSVSASREMVGRPFLTDHVAVPSYPVGTVGPLHIVACQTGATEAQARIMLGFPDAMIVNAPFGIFAADKVQQIQFVLLKDCRDETTVRNAVGRFVDWLKETGEDQVVVARARRRRAIATAIANEASE